MLADPEHRGGRHEFDFNIKLSASSFEGEAEGEVES